MVSMTCSSVTSLSSPLRPAISLALVRAASFFTVKSTGTRILWNMTPPLSAIGAALETLKIALSAQAVDVLLGDAVTGCLRLHVLDLFLLQASQDPQGLFELHRTIILPPDNV